MNNFSDGLLECIAESLVVGESSVKSDVNKMLVDAVCSSNISSVRTALNQGADNLNTWRSYHSKATLLMYAATRSAEMVRTLIRAGADVHAVDKGKRTAMDRAIMSKKSTQLEVIQELLHYGAILSLKKLRYNDLHYMNPEVLMLCLKNNRDYFKNTSPSAMNDAYAKSINRFGHNSSNRDAAREISFVIGLIKFAQKNLHHPVCAEIVSFLSPLSSSEFVIENWQRIWIDAVVENRVVDLQRLVTLKVPLEKEPVSLLWRALQYNAFAAFAFFMRSETLRKIFKETAKDHIFRLDNNSPEVIALLNEFCPDFIHIKNTRGETVLHRWSNLGKVNNSVVNAMDKNGILTGFCEKNNFGETPLDVLRSGMKYHEIKMNIESKILHALVPTGISQARKVNRL